MKIKKKSDETEVENPSASGEDEDLEGEDEGGEEEKMLGKILDTKIDRIVKAIREVPAKTKIIGEEAGIEKSVLETDPHLRRIRPFVQLSEEMKGFISDMKVLARGGIPTSLTKTLQGSDDTAGGFLVPEEFKAEVIRFATEAAIVRPRARVIPMRNNILTLPRLDQSNFKFAGIDITWEGVEGELIKESQPKFGRITLKAGKMIGVCPVSDDLLADSAINLANFLVGIFGEAIAYEEDKQFLVGDGVNKPMGIVKSGVTKNRKTASKILIEDVIAMWEALPAWATAGAVWTTTKAGFGQLMRMRADAIVANDQAGAMLFQPSLVAGVPSTLLGSSILVTDKLPIVGTKGDLILGNFSAYYVGDMGGLEVASSIHDRFRHGETVFRFIKRVDGQCALNNAFVVLN